MKTSLNKVIDCLFVFLRFVMKQFIEVIINHGNNQSARVHICITTPINKLLHIINRSADYNSYLSSVRTESSTDLIDFWIGYIA